MGKLTGEKVVQWSAMFIYCVLVAECSGLLKNCVNEAEWVNDKSGTPRCEICMSVPTRVGCFGSNSDLEVSVNRITTDAKNPNRTIVIVCNATYPIDVDQLGFKIKQHPNIFFFRHLIADNKNTSSSIYSILIPLVSFIWSPRWFIFKSLQNPDIYTRFYVYYPGPNDRSLPFDWPNGKIFPTVIEPETRYATLPCQVTHRADVIHLTKNTCLTGDDLTLNANNESLRFDPKNGFIIDTYENNLVESVWGVFTCTAQNPRKSKLDKESIQVTLRKPKEFTYQPGMEVLYTFAGSSLELRCKSSKPVKMFGMLNGQPIPQDDFRYPSNSSWRSPHGGLYVRSRVETADVGTVTCKSGIGASHTWTYYVLDLKNNTHLQFTNNGTRVTCSSKISQYLTLFNSECNNMAHCRSRDSSIESLGSGQCDLKVVQCGYKCNKRTHDKCFFNRESRRNGVFRCESEDLAVNILYLIGYDGVIYTEIGDFSKIPKNALIRIWNPYGPVYVNSPHTFACQGVSFVSNGEFQWKFQLPNGTQIFPDITNVRAYHDFITGNDSIWEADILFREPYEGIHVMCLIPIWNTKDKWLDYSIIMKVAKPVPPIFDESEPPSQTFYIGDVNRNLPCAVKGDPLPYVQWYKDGNLVNSNMTSDGGKNLVFEEVSKDVAGIWTCLATNVGGTEERDFTISVERKPNVVLHTLVALIILAGLIVALAILYWKLMQARKRIRNLTDEEVKEFLHGNAEAAKAAKEPHNAIVYLPFDTKLEIPIENLKFDIHDVLGSGAYGVVLKGKVVGCQDEVAIKTLKPHSTVDYFKALLSELKIMAYLGKHENIVNLIGAYTGRIKERVLYMVVELSPFGSLENILRNQQKSFQNQIRNDEIAIPKAAMRTSYANVSSSLVDNPLYITLLCTSDLVSMSHQIAEGMFHLASKKVIHADLATRNVLLYNNGVIKITDFGLSRQLYAYVSYMKKEQEPLPWRSMALESLREMSFSSQSDVWAYGVTLWEIFSLGAVPYPGLSWSVDFVQKLNQGLRLSKPAFATNAIYETMLQCWHSTPEHRPCFDELRTFFQTMRIETEKLSVDSV